MAATPANPPPPLDTDIEVWLLGPSVPWGLDLLQAAEDAAATVLLLPQFVPGDQKRLDDNERAWWDYLLDLHIPCGLATLRWALKACAQGMFQVPIAAAVEQSPPLLARAAPGHARSLKRGDRPSRTQLLAPFSDHWAVAGVAIDDGCAELPADPALPLVALADPSAFRHLVTLGLVERRRDHWMPRSARVIDYIDGLFPEPSGDPWRSAAITRARKALFGYELAAPVVPPYQAFDASEWHSLAVFVNQHGAQEGFFELLQISGESQWQSLFSEHTG